MMYRYKKKLICLNCDNPGHAFKNCTLPVKSYGIIAYKITHQGEKEFLLIQRRDTIGKTDFIRGKYKTNGVVNFIKLKSLVEEMTDEEKQQILTTKKEMLWDNLWLDHETGIFKNEKFKAMRLLNEIDYIDILKSSPKSRYTQREWGFPKGRKNLYESSIECAIREFKEETGLKSSEFKVYENIKFIEDFTASDGVRYSHVYFLANVQNNVTVSTKCKDVVFKQEVSDIGFFKLKEAYKLFRDYDTAKKSVLLKVSTKLKHQ